MRDYENYQPGCGKQVFDDDRIFDVNKAFCTCTSATRTIPVEDSTVLQDGTVFKAEIKFTLANDDIQHLAFRTPPASEDIPLYVLWGQDLLISDTNNVTYRLYEDGIFTPVNIQPTLNQNRPLRDIVLANSILYPDPIGIDLTNAIEIDLNASLGSQGTGASGKGSGANIPGQRFAVLRPDSDYVIEIFNDASGQIANIVFKSIFIEALFSDLYKKANP